MNLVFTFIRSILDNIYYAVYVFLECVFRTSNSWPTICSVTGILTGIVVFPFMDYVYNFCKEREISYTIGTIILSVMFISIYWLIDKYYEPRHLKIESRFKTDSKLAKLIYGIIGCAMFIFMFLIVIDII